LETASHFFGIPAIFAPMRTRPPAEPEGFPNPEERFSGKSRSNDAAGTADEELPAIVRLRYEPASGLSDEQRAHEVAFARLLNSRTDSENDAQYALLPNAFGGNSVGVDTARELYPPYAANQREHMGATLSVGRAYAVNRFFRELAKPISETPVIMFSAGGMGSGKSKIVGRMAQAYEVFAFDSTMLQPWHMELVGAAVASGRKVRIAYVHAPVETAMRRSDRRAVIEGRYVSPEQLGSAHHRVQRNVLALHEKYKGNPNVAFEVWDNSGGLNEQKEVENGIAFLEAPGNRYTNENTAINRARKAARPTEGFSGLVESNETNRFESGS
jgi:hypothetical protein